MTSADALTGAGVNGLESLSEGRSADSEDNLSISEDSVEPSSSRFDHPMTYPTSAAFSSHRGSSFFALDPPQTMESHPPLLGAVSKSFVAKSPKCCLARFHASFLTSDSSSLSVSYRSICKYRLVMVRN